MAFERLFGVILSVNSFFSSFAGDFTANNLQVENSSNNQKIEKFRTLKCLILRNLIQ